MPEHVIRAAYSDKTIRVYQAYRPEIAKPALKASRFVPPFSFERMTWIKPSFNWMMYRSGFASKPGQEFVLAIDIAREGFDWALAHAAHARYLPSVHTSHDEWRTSLLDAPVRIQWDPERDFRLNIIPGVRSIQIGLSGEAVNRYVKEWIVRIEDVTPEAHQLATNLQSGVTPLNLPDKLERPYPVDPALRKRICEE